MRWSLALQILLVLGLVVTLPASALKLVDMVQVSQGDTVTVTESYNNTTTTYRLNVMDILSDKIYIKIEKGSTLIGERVIYKDSYITVDKLQLYYTYINAPFLKIYGEDQASYQISVSRYQSDSIPEKEIQVTVVPTPLVPGKSFYILVDGLKNGEVMVLDMSGWMDQLYIRNGFAYGTIPKDVSDSLIIRIYDDRDNLIKTRVVEVSKQSTYMKATLVPQKPVRGGGLVVMFSEPFDGEGIIIDSYSGLSNMTTVSGGIAIFRIPDSFTGPVIIRITDSDGEVVYQNVVELAGEYTESRLTLSLSTTSATTGAKITATVRLGDKPVDATIYIEDSIGLLVKKVQATSGTATFTLDRSGEYQVYAEYRGIKSGKLSLRITPNLNLHLVTTNPEPGKTVVVSIPKGASYSISGPSLSLTGVSTGQVSFTPQSEGTYVVTASMDGVTKTLNINVVKKYTISARLVSSWLGRSIEASVFDSTGSPANGVLQVTKPDGSTDKVALSNGKAKISVDKEGVYTLRFGTVSTQVTVPKGGINYLPVIVLVVVVLFVLIILRSRSEDGIKLFKIREIRMHKKAYEDEEDFDDFEAPPGSREV